MGGKRKLAAAAKQLEQAQSRIAELSRYIKRLYEDNVNGKISDERFMEMSADYEAEQRELKDRAAALQDELDKAQEATVNAEKFMSIVRKSPSATTSVLFFYTIHGAHMATSTTNFTCASTRMVKSTARG